MKRTIYLSAVLSLALILGACSELKDDKNPTQGNTTIHGVGFANAASDNFHTKYLQKNGWNTQACKSCHGYSYDGGTAEQTCLTCHNKPNGPENCGTCHADAASTTWKGLAGNLTGAHSKHLSSSIECSSCHALPSQVSTTGHLDGDGKAEVKFDSVKFGVSGQSFNSSTTSCNNTYCHGNFKNGNGNSSVSWNDATGTAGQCGTCHGDVTKTTLAAKAFPKTGHPNIGTFTCNQCHSRTVDVNMNIIDKSMHANGKVD